MPSRALPAFSDCSALATCTSSAHQNTLSSYLPGLHTADVMQVVPKASVHPVGAPEPPSDGTVVVLGNRVREETMRALLVPASREEMVRLMLAVTLGVMIAAMCVQVFEPRC